MRQRLNYLSQVLDVKLSTIGETILKEEDFIGHCENPIGAVQIPLGIAGPIKMSKGTRHKSNVYIPLATTEGALVASVNRGCRAISLSGGVTVEVEKVGISRGPVFYVESIIKARELERWLRKKEKELDHLAQTTSSHLALIALTSRLVGRNLFVRFSFDTADAMGMNMATIATQRIVEAIEKETGCRCVSLAGNFDIDKKPAWLNSLFGRGKMVWAEAVVKKRVIDKVLKTQAETIAEVVYRKSLLGSALAGSVGFNAHYANIVAALFAATGQDLAHVVEGSLGITTAEVERNGDLYFSVFLPSVVAGTVGGGTGLPTQKEALSVMGVAGGDEGRNAIRFAEIAAGAVLAGELSLTASLAQGSLAKTHQRFRSA